MTDTSGSGSVFPDNIDQCPAGQELDALLAERVLDANVGRYKEEWSGYENWVATTPDGAEFFIVVSPHSAYGAVPLWNPSTNFSDAQVLLEYLYMYSDYRTMTEEVTEAHHYCVTLWAQHEGTISITGMGPSRALALCRAVYKAASTMQPDASDG
jgi:hypothetical protein